MLNMRESCAGMAFTNLYARKFGCKQYAMSEDKNSLSEELLERLRYFIEDIDAMRASRNLRKVFFDYLKFQIIRLSLGSCLPCWQEAFL